MPPTRTLISALDWGLGHGTRLVPVIRRLQGEGHEIVLASAGAANEFFKDYFPELKVVEKPAYNIRYFSGIPMSISMLIQMPLIVVAIIREHLWLRRFIRENKIDEVISDNCYGLWNKKVHSVFITHQLMVKCPRGLKFLEPLLHSIILYFVSKYDECHVPDYPEVNNLSGDLSHRFPVPGNVKFIGPLSRLCDSLSPSLSLSLSPSVSPSLSSSPIVNMNANANKNVNDSMSRSNSFRNRSSEQGNGFDVVVLLSGPEPQRTKLENKLAELLKDIPGKTCIIRGKPRTTELKKNIDRLTWFNHLPDDELKAVLLGAKRIVCRSGYSTIMDLDALKLKALLIPTPGQTEQEYLAEYNSRLNGFEMIGQEDFSLKDIVVK